MGTNDGKLQWHPAFAAALHIEFEEELDEIDIREEHLLSKKPMQVDILIIKKEKNTKIKKNIGRIFRKHNIVEYKSPDDVLTVNDFYKVYGYTCFYQSDTKNVMEIDPEELTITFVCSHYPRKMIQHLKTVRGLCIEYLQDGIYYILGDAIPMQLLVAKELSREENYWLSNLTNDLSDGFRIQELLQYYEHQKQDVYHQAVMDVIVRANWERVKEEKEKMCDALRELFAEELEECRERGLEEGRKEGLKEGRKEGHREGWREGRLEGMLAGQQEGLELAKKIFKLSAAGTSLEDISKQCEIPVERVEEILD